MTVKSFVGLHNSGNTCFLAAGTNIAIGLKQIDTAVNFFIFSNLSFRE